MMKSNYYTLEETAKNNEVRITKDDSPSGTKWIVRLSDGIPVNPESFDLKLFYDRLDKKFTDLIGSFYFIVSERLKEIIQAFEATQTEFLDVTIINEKTQESKEGYFACNILNNISAIDKKNSVLELYPSGIRIKTVKHLVLDEEAIGNRNIFRLELLEPTIIVSEKLMQAIAEEELTGIKFVPVDEFRKGVFF